MRSLIASVACLFFFSCQELIDAPEPNLAWTAFDAPGAQSLTGAECKTLEGIYTIGESADDFGKEAALKWSYVLNGSDTVHYLSFFCEEDVRYFILQAKRKDDKILLNGYWRNVENTKTGKAHFTLNAAEAFGGNVDPAAQMLSLGISGVYGLFGDEPEKKIDFRYARPLHTQTPFWMIAHRGGGRNNDLLPASENSVEMIKLAALLGANGIEIDVQLTEDGIPVLYHDARINDRLTEKTGIHGKVDEYSFAELQEEATLKRGGKIPTLEAALDTVLRKTPLEFVWVDCKLPAGMKKVVAVQQAFIQKARGLGRKLAIVIGIPDEDVLNRFLQLPGYRDIPALCELDTALALKAGAEIWAPSHTGGRQDDEALAMRARGLRTVAWTVDPRSRIREFIYEGKFDGLCTNRPTMAAYYHYARQKGK